MLFMIAVAFLACKDKKQTPEKDAAEQKTTNVVQDTSKDSAEIRSVIAGFYNWYSKNYSKLEDYHLYSSIKKKDSPPYKINWDEVEKYQNFIRRSVPQLGEEFISNQKLFFQQCDSAFKVDTEDDIPYGFDYDWYTNSQEDPQYLVNQITTDEPWIMTWAGDHAIADIQGYPGNGKKAATTVIKLAMKKEDGKWKIAKIGID